MGALVALVNRTRKCYIVSMSKHTLNTEDKILLAYLIEEQNWDNCKISLLWENDKEFETSIRHIWKELDYEHLLIKSKGEIIS